MKQVEEFIEEYQANENEITRLTKEILFLQGLDSVPNKMGNFNFTNRLPNLLRCKFFLMIETLNGELELSADDVSCLVGVREQQRESLFKKRQELSMKVKGNDEE